jgi:hypothetical protein
MRKAKRYRKIYGCSQWQPASENSRDSVARIQFIERIRGFVKGSISVPKGAKSYFLGQSCSLFSVSCGLRGPFHGDNTGSNPVGDAKYNQILSVDHAASKFPSGNATVTIEPELAPFSGFSGDFTSSSSEDSAYAPSSSFTASDKKAGLRC